MISVARIRLQLPKIRRELLSQDISVGLEGVGRREEGGLIRRLNVDGRKVHILGSGSGNGHVLFLLFLVNHHCVPHSLA